MDSDAMHDDCGCAPTAREKAMLWPDLSRRGLLGLGIVGLAAASAFAGPSLAPAFAVDYPSWEDVERAKQNEGAKAAEITRIEGLIAGLAADVAAKQAEAVRAGDEYYEAQQAFFEAAYRADELQRQADEQAQKAADAANKAGRVAAELYRNGGDDTSLELFFAGSAATADDLLARLGTMDKLVERNRGVYADAITARDSAQSLSDQAAVQRAERDRLQQEAEQKMVAAQEAAAAAEAALAAQETHRVELEAQLAALRDTTAKTIADYQAGVEARRKAEEERKRREQEAAAAAAAEAARRAEEERKRREAQQNSGGGGGGGGGSSSGGGGSGGNGGGVVGTGWARPSSGWRSSGYGWRTSQCGPQGCASSFHAGVDLAAGCGAGIFAASAGRVTYSGYNGGYGNYVRIDHGGGIGTGYGHMSAIYVGYGQWVNAGQLIGAEGNTGRSFGCHLHFECYVNGGTTNPIDFMAARGIGV